MVQSLLFPPAQKLFCFLKYLFIYYLWLCWFFVSVRGLSLVVASGGHSSSRCAGLSLSRPLLLRSTGSRRAGSVVVAHRLSCSTACGIFPDQGSNPCRLHRQADSQPLRHQGSPQKLFCKILWRDCFPLIWALLYSYHRDLPVYSLAPSGVLLVTLHTHGFSRFLICLQDLT